MFSQQLKKLFTNIGRVADLVPGSYGELSISDLCMNALTCHDRSMKVSLSWEFLIDRTETFLIIYDKTETDNPIIASGQFNNVSLAVSVPLSAQPLRNKEWNSAGELDLTHFSNMFNSYSIGKLFKLLDIRCYFYITNKDLGIASSSEGTHQITPESQIFISWETGLAIIFDPRNNLLSLGNAFTLIKTIKSREKGHIAIEAQRTHVMRFL